jgi:hypothetical protein
MTQYHVLASKGRERYTIFTKTPKKYTGKKCVDGRGEKGAVRARQDG